MKDLIEQSDTQYDSVLYWDCKTVARQFFVLFCFCYRFFAYKKWVYMW